MKIKKNKLRDYIYTYYKRSKKEKIHTLQDRREVIGEHLNFAATEAYKLLRTNLIFSMSDEASCKIIGITSSLRNEGKSSTAINLAYTIAETNKNVLLIEADMRIPIFVKLLQLTDTVGLSNVLAGVNSLSEVIRASTLLPSLSVITAGEIPPNPSELLSSVRMEQTLKTLSELFDYIIIDLPPVNAVSDSLVISKLLSGMVMVVRQNYCDQHALASAMRQLEFLKVKLLGFVLNDMEMVDNRYKKYRSKKYRIRHD